MTTFKLTELVPMLETDDMEETIHFYTTVLGFTVVEILDDEDEKPVWVSLMHGLVEIMFKIPNAVMSYGQILLTGNLYMHASDPDAVWLQVKDAATVVYPLQNFPYGMREFAIQDNNGYVLTFGAPITAQVVSKSLP